MARDCFPGYRRGPVPISGIARLNWCIDQRWRRTLSSVGDRTAGENGTDRRNGS